MGVTGVAVLKGCNWTGDVAQRESACLACARPRVRILAPEG
jgi:hypothetical protein